MAGWRFALAAALVMAGISGLSCLARAATPAAASRPVRIIYLAGSSAYLDAGASEGFMTGDTLVVRRLGSEVAMLVVSDVSSHRAACDTLLTRTALRTGDEVRVIGRAPRPEAAAAEPGAGAASIADSSAAPIAAKAPRARPWLRGRAGARWMSASAEGSVRVDQPMLDLRLDGGSGETVFSGGLDLRGRQILRTSSNGDEARDTEARVYRAQFNWRQPGVPLQFSAGRLTSPSLALVSLFDGGLIQASRGTWKAGVFGGTQPEPAHMGWSKRVTEYGGFVETHQRGFPERRWQAGLGAVSSYEAGQSSRDFVFTQGFYRDAWASGSWLQEADILRPYKRGPNDAGFSLTSTFLSAQAQVTPQFSLQSGYDNRRNVRLWRDRVTPETEFDDRYRQGVWAGGLARFRFGLTVSGDRRWNRGGGDNATVSSGSAELRARRWRGVSLRGRWSRFDSDLTESRLVAGSLGLNPTAASHVEFSAGRRTTALAGGGSDAPVGWWGASTDLSLWRRWFMDASYETARGELEHTTQFYAGISRRL
jgi:hypothetical protein